MAFQLMTGVTSTAPQVMTSVNRQDAGREVTSNPARFLLEFTPIHDTFTGVYSDLPVVDPVFMLIFSAIWGVFDEIRTTFGRFLPENGRLLVTPEAAGIRPVRKAGAGPRYFVSVCCFTPGFGCTEFVRKLYGNVRFVYGFCTEMPGFWGEMDGLMTTKTGRGWRRRDATLAGPWGYAVPREARNHQINQCVVKKHRRRSGDVEA